MLQAVFHMLYSDVRIADFSVAVTVVDHVVVRSPQSWCLL
jgi:hypothetical protein